jgi:hypothetical protein
VLYHPRRCSIFVGIATKKYLAISGGFFYTPADEAGYHAPLSNPMRHGHIPNRKLKKPRTIMARERFRTKPCHSPQRHHESQRIDLPNRKAAAVNRTTTRIYRVGPIYYQPTSAGYLVALPNPISVIKILTSEEQPSTFKTILGRKVDGQGTGSHERRVL